MLKATGIVRVIDELGRIVLPIELRRNLNINQKDSIEIYVDEEKIVLKKYEPLCYFCKKDNKITLFKGKNICQDCINDLHSHKTSFE